MPIPTNLQVYYECSRQFSKFCKLGTQWKLQCDQISSLPQVHVGCTVNNARRAPNPRIKYTSCSRTIIKTVYSRCWLGLVHNGWIVLIHTYDWLKLRDQVGWFSGQPHNSSCKTAESNMMSRNRTSVYANAYFYIVLALWADERHSKRLQWGDWPTALAGANIGRLESLLGRHLLKLLVLTSP